jgi:hypothetical protein
VSIVKLATAVCLLLSVSIAVSAAAPVWKQVPSTVTSRLKKLDTHMERVEAALAEGVADRNNLKWAQQYLQEIEKQYPQHANAPEVAAARERVRLGEQAILKIETGKQAEKDKQEQEQKSADQIAEEWAEKLEVYAPKDSPGAKGDYGTPLGKVEDILTRKAHYEEAKALFEQFKQTGIDKDSHWKLRSAVYSIQVGIENYESSFERLVSRAEEHLRERGAWIAGQRNSKTPYIISTLELMGLREQFEDVRRLFPESNPRRQALEATMAKLEQDRAAVEAVVLKSRKMKADQYKGADAAEIKSLAKTTLKKEFAKPEYGGKAATFLRVHIISATWNTESATEWTDTTRSAVQYRVTRGMNVQVVAKVGSECYLFTLFVHRDTISGSQSGLLAHVMFRDRFLEANVPK